MNDQDYMAFLDLPDLTSSSCDVDGWSNNISCPQSAVEPDTTESDNQETIIRLSLQKIKLEQESLLLQQQQLDLRKEELNLEMQLRHRQQSGLQQECNATETPLPSSSLSRPNGGEVSTDAFQQMLGSIDDDTFLGWGNTASGHSQFSPSEHAGTQFQLGQRNVPETAAPVSGLTDVSTTPSQPSINPASVDALATVLSPPRLCDAGAEQAMHSQAITRDFEVSTNPFANSTAQNKKTEGHSDGRMIPSLGISRPGRRKRRPSNPDIPGIICFETRPQEAASSNAKRRRTRAELDSSRLVRKVGACFRCRLYKIKCSDDSICTGCIRAARRCPEKISLRILCIRTSLLECNIFEHFPLPETSPAEGEYRVSILSSLSPVLRQCQTDSSCVKLHRDHMIKNLSYLIRLRSRACWPFRPHAHSQRCAEIRDVYHIAEDSAIGTFVLRCFEKLSQPRQLSSCPKHYHVLMATNHLFLIAIISRLWRAGMSPDTVDMAQQLVRTLLAYAVNIISRLDSPVPADVTVSDEPLYQDGLVIYPREPPKIIEWFPLGVRDSSQDGVTEVSTMALDIVSLFGRLYLKEEIHTYLRLLKQVYKLWMMSFLNLTISAGENSRDVFSVSDAVLIRRLATER